MADASHAPTPRRRVWLAQIGAAAALLLLGVALGRWARPPVAAQDVVEIRQQLHDVHEMLTLSLLQQTSATERLQGISWSTRIEQPGNDVLNALLDALMHDPNVNVRLATVDALRRFSDRAAVREHMIETVADTSHPLVQVAAIDFLVDTKDRAASTTLRRLSGDSSASAVVRARAVRGLAQLGS